MPETLEALICLSCGTAGSWQCWSPLQSPSSPAEHEQKLRTIKSGSLKYLHFRLMTFPPVLLQTARWENQFPWSWANCANTKGTQLGFKTPSDVKRISLPSVLHSAFELTPYLSTLGLLMSLHCLKKPLFLAHSLSCLINVTSSGIRLFTLPLPTQKKKNIRGEIRCGGSQFGLSYLGLEVLHWLLKSFWYRPLMVAQDGHSSVSSVVGEQLSSNIVVS